MKQKEIDNLNLMYNKLGRICFICGKPATERGHVLGQGKHDRAVFGNEIIDSPYNWLPVCQEHNGVVDLGHAAWPMFANNHSKWVKYMNDNYDYETIDKEVIIKYYTDLFRSMDRLK